MEALPEFTIPIEGLGDGVHQFDFQIDKSFFDHFQNSPIKDGKFDLKLYFDKRPDMLVLTFEFAGSYVTDCDRCLESIDLPVKDSQQLLVKYADEPKDDTEIIYITKETQLLNVAKYAYDCIGLAIPISKVCDEIDDPPCNDKMLDYLDEKEEEENESQNNPIWEALKNFKKNN